MSTVLEIESAIDQLPEKEMREIYERLGEKIRPTRPDGYFASDYPLPDDRIELEEAMFRIPQHPDR